MIVRVGTICRADARWYEGPRPRAAAITVVEADVIDNEVRPIPIIATRARVMVPIMGKEEIGWWAPSRAEPEEILGYGPDGI